ncbi:MAG: cell division protein ZapD [Pseudomonadota bacterium]
MAYVVENAVDAGQAPAESTYEQPLNERMRTFLRLEFLYRKTNYHFGRQDELDTRQTIDSILEIGAILARGDVRSEVLKEIEKQSEQLQCFLNSPGVDTSRLMSVIEVLGGHREAVNSIGPHYLQTIKDSEFLSAIKHRSAIPGGTCEFDLPLFSHWLRRDYDDRKQDMSAWLKELQPLCSAVTEVMWLIRQSGQSSDCVAQAGIFPHSLSRESNCRMLRVTLKDQRELFPEISGSPQRFTIRFLRWDTVDARPVQTDQDVPFQLGIC